MMLRRIPWPVLRDAFERVYPHLGYVALKRYGIVGGNAREVLVGRLDMLDDAIELWLDSPPPDTSDVRNEETARAMGRPLDTHSPEEMREAVARGEHDSLRVPVLQVVDSAADGVPEADDEDDVDDDDDAVDVDDDDDDDDVDVEVPPQRRDTSFTLPDALEALRRFLLVTSDQNTPQGETEKFRCEFWKYGGAGKLYSHIFTFRSTSLPADASPEETHSETVAQLRAEEESHRNRQLGLAAEAEATLLALREVGIIDPEKKKSTGPRRKKNEEIEIPSAVDLLEDRMDDEVYDETEGDEEEIPAGPAFAQPGIPAGAMPQMDPAAMAAAQAGIDPGALQALQAAGMLGAPPPADRPLTMGTINRHHAILLDQQNMFLQMVLRTTNDLLGISHASHAQATRTNGAFLKQMSASLESSRSQTDGLLDTFQAQKIDELAATMEAKDRATKTEAGASALRTFIEQGMGVAKAVTLHHFAKQHKQGDGNGQAHGPPPAQVAAPASYPDQAVPPQQPTGAPPPTPGPGQVQPDLGDWLLQHGHVIDGLDDPGVRAFLADPDQVTLLRGLAKVYEPEGVAKPTGAQAPLPPSPAREPVLEDDLPQLDVQTPPVDDLEPMTNTPEPEADGVDGDNPDTLTEEE